MSNRPSFFNVTDFGAVGNGIADDTDAIAQAMNAASSSFLTGQGGAVVLPPGTYLSSPITLLSNVALWGAGPKATILKLKGGANADLLSANTSFINLSAS